VKGLNGSKKLGVRMWTGVCICEDGNKLMVSLSGKDFIVRSVSFSTGSNSVLL
jgi:hypothetical protein